jgi:tRNA A-37 threonylcarbamoyl transferase component Bud32
MDEVPFPIAIEPVSSDGRSQTVTCLRLLRDLGGKRKVFDAIWNQQPVTVKIFTDPLKAKYHMKREWRGLRLLQERGLSSPTPLFCGRSKQGGWAVVTKKILDAPTIREIWDGADDEGIKHQLLRMVGKELAAQHSKGVLQKDLHLGNFLLQGERLFALDAAQMRFFPHQVDRRKSVSQLALLKCNLPADEMDSFAEICKDYFRARGWDFDKSDEELLRNQASLYWKAAIRRELKKCIRTSRRYLKVKTGRYIAVFSRDFSQGADLPGFIEKVDELITSGQVLKVGNTSYVARSTWNGKDIVIKRYNHKGFLHSLRHTIKRSRARRSWVSAHRLSLVGVATPRPLAYIEHRKGPLVWKSYLVTEYVAGQKLGDFLIDSGTDSDKCVEAVKGINKLIEKLKKYRIIHSDLKDSNILVTESGPVLTDLDSMKVHRLSWTYNLSHRKDLRRFTNRGSGGYGAL